MWGTEIAMMGAMIAINSVFAAYEIALASVSVGRLKSLVEEKVRSAAVALYMKENIEASLAVIQLGITLVGAVAAAVGGAGAEEKIAPLLTQSLGLSNQAADLLAIAMVVLPLTVITIIVGELIPKVFALRHSEWVCLTLSPFMRWFSFSVWPAVWFFETVVTGVMALGTRSPAGSGQSTSETAEIQELRATAALARANRLICARAEEIIVGATEMRETLVHDIMLPASEISTLTLNASLADNLIAAHLDMHTRFPVVSTPGDAQTIVGYVNVKDIIAMLHLNPREPTIAAILRPIPCFRDEMPVAECLEHLLQQHIHIALVRNEQDCVVGMVSLEDILEELVGEIHDEYDGLPGHVHGAGSHWVVGGGTHLDKLAVASGINLALDLPPPPLESEEEPPPTAKTVSDWIVGHLQRGARGGDVLERGPIRVVVRKSRRQQVLEAQFSLLTPPSDRAPTKAVVVPQT